MSNHTYTGRGAIFITIPAWDGFSLEVETSDPEDSVIKLNKLNNT